MEGLYRLLHENKPGTFYAPTIKSDNPIYLSNCARCGSSRFNFSNEDISLIVETNMDDYCPHCHKILDDHNEDDDCPWINDRKELPDYLLCGHYPITIISKKFLEGLTEKKVTNYSASKIKKLFDVLGNNLPNMPEYYKIDISTQLELDLEKMGISIIDTCSICGSKKYDKNTWEFGSPYIKINTYDDEKDLFVVDSFGAIICTEKVIKMAYDKKLTNIRFAPFESMFTLNGAK